MWDAYLTQALMAGYQLKAHRLDHHSDICTRYHITEKMKVGNEHGKREQQQEQERGDSVTRINAPAAGHESGEDHHVPGGKPIEPAAAVKPVKAVQMGCCQPVPRVEPSEHNF